MTNEEKLEAVKAFLNENKFKFVEHYRTKNNARANLFVPKFRILVRISDENDQKFYNRIVHYFHPLFIRETETKEFVLEKMQNLIIDLMKSQHNKHQKAK